MLLVICFVISIGLSVTLVVISPIYLFTEQLVVGDPIHEQGEVTFLIFDVSGREVAHLVLRTSTHRLQTDQHLTYIRLHIWHTNTTHLDSLFIQFDPMIPNHIFQVYLETPMGRDWDVTITEATGNRYAYQFPELGVYGTGTLNVGFFIQKDLDLSIRVTTRMMLHDTTFPVVTQQYAIASTEIDS